MKRTLSILTVVFYVASAPLASFGSTGKQGCSHHGKSQNMAKADMHKDAAHQNHTPEIPMTGHKMAMSGGMNSCKHTNMDCKINSHGKCDKHVGGCTISSCSSSDGVDGNKAFQYNTDIVFMNIPEISSFGDFQLESGFDASGGFAFSDLPDRPPSV